MSINNVPLAKALLNKTKQKIMQSIKEEEKTVKEIAADIGVPASRLYYHMKQLEEASVIRQTRSEEKGNLRQKYYIMQTVVPEDITISGDVAKEVLPHLMRKTHEVIANGMTVLEEEIRRGATPEDKNAQVIFVSLSLTCSQWERLNEAVSRVLDEDLPESEPEEEKHDYEYLLFTYKAKAFK